MTKFVRCEHYSTDLILHWLGNEVNLWYICLEMRLQRQETINQPHFQAFPLWGNSLLDLHNMILHIILNLLQ